MRVTNFEIGDLNETVDTATSVKHKVRKVSRLRERLMRIISEYKTSDNVDFDDQQLIIDLMDSDEPDADYNDLLGNDVIKRIYPLCRIGIMMDKIKEFIPKTSSDFDNVNYRYDGWKYNWSDNERRFIAGVLSEIHATDHPLYAVYSPKDRFELHNIIICMPDDANLNWVDISKIDNISHMFSFTDFVGDISLWDTTNVLYMYETFYGSTFNGNISKWRFPDAINLTGMFSHSKFNGDISEWEFPEVHHMRVMFASSEFNGDISRWRFPKATDISFMFADSKFNGDISEWEFPNLLAMDGLFSDNKVFNGDISKWRFPMLHTMIFMFNGSVFNGDISEWEFPNVYEMQNMFSRSEFNGDISKWKFPKVRSLRRMFEESVNFNCDISGWDVSNVECFEEAFKDAKAFKQDLSGWCVNEKAYTDRMFKKSKVPANYRPKLPKRKSDERNDLSFQR